MEEMTAREKARLRKQKSRKHRATREGENRVEVVLSDRELAALERGRHNRNPGREPYSRNEYLALLLLNDEAALAAQERELSACTRCGEPPPAHCGGAFKGEGWCWLSVDCLRLNLTSVTGHSNNVDEV